MQISSNLSKDDISRLQQEFYDYFKTGYTFEEFLKEYLFKWDLMRLKSHNVLDGGIDLKAMLEG